MSSAFDRLQYVCGVLSQLDDGKGQMPVEFIPPAHELSSSTCFQILKRHMNKPKHEPTSLRDMWSFVNILFTTLSQLHDSASPVNAAMLPDPFVESKFDSLLKQSIKHEICTFVVQTARDFASNTADATGENGEQIGFLATGFSHLEFNHATWRLQPFTFAGKEVYKLLSKNYLLYFRVGSGRWVIDDEIVPSGSGYAASTTCELTGQWKTSPGWTTCSQIRVTMLSNGNYTVAGCTGVVDYNGASSSVLDNGTYIKQPDNEKVNGRPQYVLRSPELTARGEQRHLIYSNLTKCWKINPTCEEDEGSNLIQQGMHHNPDQGAWQRIPGDVVDNVRFTPMLAKPKTATSSFSSVAVAAQGEEEEKDEDDDDEDADNGENQLAHLVPWSSSNHESMLFSNKTSTLAFFSLRPSRLREKMNPLLIRFLESNRITVGEDLTNASTKKYHKLLCALTNVSKTEAEADALLDGGRFAVTGRALLKFLAICMRIRCGIPVVLLGECGCGKTYSVKFIAAWLNLRLFCLDVHGGTEERDVLGVIQSAEEWALATGEKVVVFLDEINACAHLGLMEEVLVQRRAFGRRIDDRLVLVAALNPYRVVSDVKADSAGLRFAASPADGSLLPALAPGKNLVYLVHPVPSSLAFLAFDYGALQPAEENKYIASMAYNVLSAAADKFPKLADKVLGSNMLAYLVAWVAAAQEFVRTSETDVSAASLRDAQRMLQLTGWFLGLADGKPAASENCAVMDCIVLGLAFAYMFRLPSRDLRSKFWDAIRCASYPLGNFFPECSLYKRDTKLETVLASTQRGFTQRFQLERGIAMNEALSENLFLCVVCILNRIPLFLVGKPGTSKTLALQIAASNLLGRSSPRPFWRKFPGLAVFTYQCSPLSTAQEIKRQFDVACRYQSHASEQVSVFVLDEVGLAEFSPSLPLKVLHSMLVDPPCAVIGVSNWTLDRAKMNRAILLTRPEPSVFDLKFTGERISQSFTTTEICHPDWWLEGVATTFYALYAEEQSSGREFWGMRDYYALVRQLKSAPQVTVQVLTVALCRNLGGKPDQILSIVARFKRAVFNA
ncbi:hypothetical protein BASA81_010609 [Batrachochytrium salamandrivorans]|nr:hypothetical protein BASA81_010609 [Batrachochytrium salamandrivorans]